MKIQKFKTDNAGNALGTAAGVIAGAMLSSGVSGAIPMQNKTAAKAIVAVAGVALTAFVGGQDAGAKAVRNIGIGMTAQQGKEIISEAVKPMLPASTGKATQFLHDALGSGGLAVSLNARSAMAARLGRARMGNPDLFKMANPELITSGEFAAI
ncbi:hypothetical protein [Gelidibacter japonicus]|uniref:hypothetical protein n=1 Tax=Gelidibacter japonicus TaxID=1962232 RepID=UPI002B00286C|nr:hypothetical protein [Gelidibacter japonicus]